MSQLYKNKYCLALYDENDSLINVFDNCYELSKFFNRSFNSTCCIVGRCISGATNFIKHDNKKYKIFKIEVI